MTTNIRRVINYYKALPPYEVGKKGKFEITKTTIPAGNKICVVSYRNAIFCNQKPLNVICDEPINVFSLSEEEQGTWMSTTFQEIGQMDPVIQEAYGNVLIGGLGLGVIAHLIAENGDTTVDVVEREGDLIDLVRPFLNEDISIIHADLFDYEIIPYQYDFAFLDIWQSTGEWTWQTQVVPLRRAIRPNIPIVRCWQEEEMTGQVLQMLFRVVDMDEELLEGMASTQHYWVFRKAVVEQGLRKEAKITEKNMMDFAEVWQIQQENAEDKDLEELAKMYLQEVGTDMWENVFGKYWDQTLSLLPKK